MRGNIATSPKLLALLERARGHKMTAQEVFLQRVSFVFGQQDHDCASQRTKRQIAHTLADACGYPAEWAEGVRD